MARTQNYTLTRPLGHPRTPPDGAPARPRDAATVILVRDGSDGPETLMGKRHRKAKFIPDAYVFPGGRVDRADHTARPASNLNSNHVPRMAVRRNSDKARALAMAAVRETYEETGLLFARPGDVGNTGHESWSELREAGMAPDLARLTYVGRAITSPYSPIRFHARFFMADAEHAEGDLGGSGELSDLHWTPVTRALTELPIVDVTEFMLHQILETWPNVHDDRERPLFAYRRDRPYVQFE